MGSFSILKYKLAEGAVHFKSLLDMENTKEKYYWKLFMFIVYENLVCQQNIEESLHEEHSIGLHVNKNIALKLYFIASYRHLLVNIVEQA